MSIEASKKKVEKLQAELEKAHKEMREKGAKLMEDSGLLELNISDKDLKKELKTLRDKLKKS